MRITKTTVTKDRSNGDIIVYTPYANNPLMSGVLRNKLLWYFGNEIKISMKGGTWAIKAPFHPILLVFDVNFLDSLLYNDKLIHNWERVYDIP